MTALENEKKREVLNAAADFALRVMKGNAYTPQETAVLPAVLDLLFLEEKEKARSYKVY